METVKQVNAWVKEQTMGLIDGVLDQPLDAQAVLLLVNALYLKNAWAAPFDPAKTTALPFRSAAGMRQTEFLGQRRAAGAVPPNGAGERRGAAL